MLRLLDPLAAARAIVDDPACDPTMLQQQYSHKSSWIESDLCCIVFDQLFAAKFSPRLSGRQLIFDLFEDDDYHKVDVQVQVDEVGEPKTKTATSYVW